jgi:NADH-quinone oxidoreductase subunit J
MDTVFYVSGAVAVGATLMAITRLNAIHALLWVLVSLLAVAVVFFALGAPFVAALEVIIYAGAIVVLLLFVVMLLNLGHRATRMERELLTPGMWVWPSVVAAALLAEFIYLMTRGEPTFPARQVGPKEVSIALFGPYVIAVELASTLLLAGLVGAFHLGWRTKEKPETRDGLSTDRARAGSGGDLVRAGTDGPARTP